jgi:hypothetical protein
LKPALSPATFERFKIVSSGLNPVCAASWPGWGQLAVSAHGEASGPLKEPMPGRVAS